jgi:sulfite exporter TauE/SafE
MEFLMAFSMGLFGSLHCVGMCGPLALALPIGNLENKILARFLYNLGRILTYTMAGFLFGLFGKGLAIAGLQQIVSISLGIIILLSLFVNLRLFQQFRPSAVIYRLAGSLKASLRKLFTANSYPALLAIGLVNGLLPCGLIYLALAASISTGDPFKGAVFMFFFGVGTAPLMFVVSSISSILKDTSLVRLKNVIPAVMLVVGVLLIVRGLNAGIPYLSPQINIESGIVHKCH